MCYDIKASLKAQLKRAQQNGDEQAIREIMEKLLPHTDLPLHHASGFTHPRLLIYPSHSPYTPLVATWGLVPAWVRDEAQKNQLWNNTLNARGETLFEKPAFRDAVIHQRCLVYLDGFYEHHHLNRQAYPFYVQRSDQAPFAVAGLWSTWQHPLTGIPLTTFTLVTRPANTLMAKIHNNSGEKGPRMPLILEQDEEAQWLQPLDSETSRNQLEGLIHGEAKEELVGYPVGPLRGKTYRGNVPEISQEEVYPELGFFEF